MVIDIFFGNHFCVLGSGRCSRVC